MSDDAVTVTSADIVEAATELVIPAVAPHPTRNPMLVYLSMTRSKMSADDTRALVAREVASAVCLVGVSVAIHEGAHAIVAQAFGARVRVVKPGHGPVVRVLRVCGRRIEIRERLRLGAWSGLVRWSARRNRMTWAKFGMVAAAGPVASAAWALALCVASWWVPLLLPAAVFALSMLRPSANRSDATQVWLAARHVAHSLMGGGR